MKLKLDSPYHKVDEMVVAGNYQVYKILSTPRYVMYAPHWNLLYFITQLEIFKEGFEYDVERV